MITLTQLEYIVAIDEYRHFATAAEKMFRNPAHFKHADKKA